MKWTTKKKLRDGSFRWYFSPPKSAVSAGVVSRKYFDDGRTARYEVPRLIKIVEDFKKGGIAASSINKDHNMLEAITFFLNTEYYIKSSYSYNKRARESAFKSLKTFIGKTKIKDINAYDLNKDYKLWIEARGLLLANHMLTALILLCDFLVVEGLMEVNYAKSVVKQTTIIREKQSTDWSIESAQKVIEHCLSSFETTSLGLLLLLVYETAQKAVTILELEWDNINLDSSSVSLPRSGLTVKLKPATIHLLKQQKEMWGFQKYVLPYHRVFDNSYRPLKFPGRKLSEICIKLGYSGKLDLPALRLLAIREFVAAGMEPAYLANLLGVNGASVAQYYKGKEINVEKR